MLNISFPKNPILKVWIFWIICKCALKISYELNYTGSLEDQTTDIIYGIFLPWFCGGIWSSFNLISYGAIAINIYIVLVVLKTIPRLMFKSKVWVWILFSLAMYTVWIEPWLSLATQASENIDAKTITTFVSFSLDYIVGFFLPAASLIVSLAWLFSTYLITQLLGEKY